MTKSRNNTTLKEAKKIAVSLLVLVTVFLPVFTTINWLKVVVFGNESRKVIKIADANPKKYEDLKPFEEPLITITFDDGWESIYSNGFQEMESVGIKSTQYVLGDEFSNISYMSEDQVRSLQTAGHEVASHTMTHPKLTEIEPSELEYEIVESKKLLSKKFGDVKDFATPLGAYDEEVIDQISKNYRSHRNTDADPSEVDELDVNVKHKFNKYNIIAYTVRRTTTKEDITRLINFTVKSNGWLVLTYHQIDDSDAQFGVSRQTFSEHLAIVKAAKARTPVMGQVLDAIDALAERGSSNE